MGNGRSAASVSFSSDNQAMAIVLDPPPSDASPDNSGDCFVPCASGTPHHNRKDCCCSPNAASKSHSSTTLQLNSTSSKGDHGASLHLNQYSTHNSEVCGTNTSRHEHSETSCEIDDPQISGIYSDAVVSGLPSPSQNKEVILRLEVAKEKQFKGILIWMQGCLLLSLLALIVLVVIKATADEYSLLLRSDGVVISNVIVSSILLIILTPCCLLLLKRLSELRHKTWNRYSKRVVVVITIQVAVQMVNLCFVAVPSAYVWTCAWGWFDDIIHIAGFIRWSCWNTLFYLYAVQGQGLMRMEVAGSLRGLIRYFTDNTPGICVAGFLLACNWLGVEGLLVAFLIHILRDEDVSSCSEPPHEMYIERCTVDTSNYVDVFPLAFGITINLYLCLIMFFIVLSMYRLQKVSYCKYRVENVIFKLQMRTLLLASVMNLLSFNLLWFTEYGSCNSYVTTWLGMLPMQITTTGLLVTQTYMFFPQEPSSVDRLQSQLQQFSWLESTKAELVADEGYPATMFCFETALKAMYWSYLAYDATEVSDSKYNTQDALPLWKCTHFELVWDRVIDTKAVIGWGCDCAVVAFKGTASARNIVTDLSVKLTKHPSAQGSESVLSMKAMVHSGFLQGWTYNQLNTKIVNRLDAIIRQRPTSDTPRPPFRIITTGHSLGGALATLAAYELSVAFKSDVGTGNVSVTCYTFGAPRCGNHAFAAECRQVLPDIWNVVNHQDVIVHSGKLVVYKRPGQRVVINQLGDLVVCPGYLESQTYHARSCFSVDNHLLSSYGRSMAAIVASQFGGERALEGGAETVLRMCDEDEAMKRLLKNAFGMEYKVLKAALVLAPEGGMKGPLAEYVRPPYVDVNAIIRACLPFGF